MGPLSAPCPASSRRPPQQPEPAVAYAAGVEMARHRHVALLMGRELAANMATPMFLVDADATLVYFNEAAGTMFGASFGEIGELKRGQWSARFQPTRHVGDQQLVTAGPPGP